MMNRRTFVGALAALAAVGGSGVATLLARRRRLEAGYVTADRLRSLVGTRGALVSRTGNRTIAEIADLRAVRREARPDAPRTEQISLLLRPRDPEIGNGTYRLETEDLVLGDLYYSGVGPAGRDRRLEAVITRIL